MEGNKYPNIGKLFVNSLGLETPEIDLENMEKQKILNRIIYSYGHTTSSISQLCQLLNVSRSGTQSSRNRF